MAIGVEVDRKTVCKIASEALSPLSLSPTIRNKGKTF